MNLFRAGRTRELTLCYRKNRALLLGVAQGVLRDKALAEDAVQEAWLKVGRLETDKIADAEKLRNLLVIVVKNTAISFLRARRNETPLEFSAQTELPDTAPTAAERAEAKDAAARLRGALAALPVAEQDLLLLKYDNGLTNAQIALLLVLPEETVKKRVQRVRAKLKTAWEVQENEREHPKVMGQPAAQR
ncbi:MAG: sigma-70 family RNA polymerase sigma factor [Gemmiger sp.]|nr:sigma-70 family RNA polymerase sigma factor [Gemmiger sp.]